MKRAGITVTGAAIVVLCVTSCALESANREAPSVAPQSQQCHARVIQAAATDFPEKAKQARLTGRVVATYSLDGSGKPQDIKVVESTSRVFDAAVIDALRRTEF